MNQSLASEDTHSKQQCQCKKDQKYRSNTHKQHTLTYTHIQRCLCAFLCSGSHGSGGLQGHLWLPQQGLFRGRRRVTILALWRLLGHLFINVPRRHPEP